jgi:DNA mismatch endonuclease, patch repair protein
MVARGPEESGEPHPRSPATDPAVSRRMRATRRRDTSAEMRIRSALHRRGWRYRVDRRVEPDVRGRPDLAFTRERVAVFIDGCFWHGCPDHFSKPRTRTAWWSEKISQNRVRDRRTTVALEERGWTVLRIWEHSPTAEAVEQIEAALSASRSRER